MQRTEQPRKTILVAEDNHVTREVFGVVLQQAGYGVVLVATGHEALTALRTPPRPDLILLDMLMPVLDGWHFLEQLQHDSLRPSIPIIVVTGTNLSREWAEDHGCQGFVRKPVETHQLLEEVRRCLA